MQFCLMINSILFLSYIFLGDLVTERGKRKNIGILYLIEFPWAMQITPVACFLNWMCVNTSRLRAVNRGLGGEMIEVKGVNVMEREVRKKSSGENTHFTCPSSAVPAESSLGMISESVWIFFLSLNSAKTLLSVSGQPLLAKLRSSRGGC